MKRHEVAIICILVPLFVIFYQHVPKEHLKDPVVYHEVPEGASIIVLSPHLDDAVLSLGGFLYKYRGRAEVATFFIKKDKRVMNTYWDRISGFNNSSESVESRKSENINALNISSSTPIDFTFNDSQYRNRKLENQSKIIEDISSIIDEMLRQDNNKIINIYGPSDFGHKITHPDHFALHRAFLEIYDKYKDNKNISFYLYEDFPYIRVFNNDYRTNFRNFLANETNSNLTEEVIKLSDAELHKKTEALSFYTSQIRAFDFLGNKIILDAENFTLSRNTDGPSEVVYKLNPTSLY